MFKASNIMEGYLTTLNDGRAGRYIRQPSGYSAFIPSPLPPNPPIQLDDELIRLVSRADRALGRLDGSILTLPDPDLFVFMYVRKEAVLSSQIEGTQSSLNDLLEAEAKVFRRGRPRDVDEVINYVAAARQGLDRLKSLPVSTRLIREIHRCLLAGVRGHERQPGEIRRSQNWIGPSGCTLNEATFVPPPAPEVPGALSDLERFLHSGGQLPTLLEIGLAHAQFETIHPFLDGNGRLGRLLITFLLCERQILAQPVLYLSHFLKQHRQEYYDLLQAIRDRGEWEPWLSFFLTAVSEVAGEATTTARGIVQLRERDRDRVVTTFGRAAGNGLIVLESLYTRPLISVSDTAGLTGTSFSAANQLIRRFVDVGILREATGQARNRVFRYDDYVGLFSDR